MKPFKDYLKQVNEYGVVEQVTHPIVTVVGLPGARLHELVIFETGQEGEIFSLNRENIQVLVFSQHPLRVGVAVARTDKMLSVPVGEELLGHIIDPLGSPVSKMVKFVRPIKERELEVSPLGLTSRSKIKEPFLTGVALVDLLLPLGKGQKELVVGDSKSGKTSFLLSSIKNQVERNDAIAIYAGIGKKRSELKKIEEYLKKEKVLDKTVMVVSTSYDCPGLIYLTPYSAMAIAEYFRDQGNHVLIIFDDLSTHAKFYREISLIARRFPGRDSYPGDIFYAHARLMERAGNFKTKDKDASITALPVAEVTEGDLTAFIPTNLMGMTDGHIYFDKEIYLKGRRPSINIGLSVTRVGRQTQSKLLQEINRELTAFLANYEKMQELTHFGAEMNDSAKAVLKKGEVVYNFFESDYLYSVPLPVQLLLFSLIWSDLVDLNTVLSYQNNLIKSYQDTRCRQLIDKILQVEDLDSLMASIKKNKEGLLSICTQETK